MAKPRKVGDSMLKDEAERLLFIYASLKKEIRDQPLSVSNIPHILTRAIGCLRSRGISTWLGYEFPDGLLGCARFIGEEHKTSFSH